MNILTEDERVQIDLGCGPVAVPGFVGVDRFILPGVGIAADLNKSLPFADNVVDLLFASHSLEHVENLMFTMNEIYRVCKHGAQICIVSPYYQQGLNFANPYHKQVFNEHTPRFWTKSHDVFIEKTEYSDHPASYLWGLAESDNSTVQIDIRLLKVEFFYFPEYRNLSPEEQRFARKKYIDVCDQIMYNLIVVKEPMSEEDSKNIESLVEYYEPPYVTIRRLREENDQLEVQIAQLRGRMQELLTKQSEAEQKWSEAEQSSRITLQNMVHEIILLRSSRIRKMIDWVYLLFRHSGMENMLNPNFQQLWDDSYIFNSSLKGYVLQSSEYLGSADFQEYSIEFLRANLKSISIAPILEIRATTGIIGIEIVSPNEKIEAQVVFPLIDVDGQFPVEFQFPPIPETKAGNWKLRVFIRDADVPVKVFEWKKAILFSKMLVHRIGFFGFSFEE